MTISCNSCANSHVVLFACHFTTAVCFVSNQPSCVLSLIFLFLFFFTVRFVTLPKNHIQRRKRQYLICTQISHVSRKGLCSKSIGDGVLLTGLGTKCKFTYRMSCLKCISYYNRWQQMFIATCLLNSSDTRRNSAKGRSFCTYEE